MRVQDFVRTYPHKDKELFKLHCAYHKHEMQEVLGSVKNTGIHFGRCSCGAVFFVGDRGLLFPIWQKLLAIQDLPQMIGEEHIKWNHAFYSDEHAHRHCADYDARLLMGLGLGATEAVL